MAFEENKTIISFIIPAYNEEDRIKESIQAIKRNNPQDSYEIIVVDNGSTDSTSEIVMAESAILIKVDKDTIASARNRGVSVSCGQILIFLDADVLVTGKWQNEIDKTIRSLREDPFIVTGSRCDVPDDRNWIFRYWFHRMQNEKPNYINSGHLITTKKLFQSIGGFRKEFSTSEDYDFCARAKGVGARIINNPNLQVIHTGYPKTLKEFVLRERWHGFEDFKSVKNIMRSKMALVAVVNIIIAVSFIIMAVLQRNFILILVYLMLSYILLMILTLIKFGYGRFVSLMVTPVIFFFYVWGRSLSFIDRIKALVL
jgi:glycosyltransferase involved in cell wall biosynthesis